MSEERARWPPKQPRHLIRSKPLRDTPNLKTSQSTMLMAAGVVVELCQNSQLSPPTAARNDRLHAGVHAECAPWPYHSTWFDVSDTQGLDHVSFPRGGY